MTTVNKIIAETQQSHALRKPILECISKYFDNRYVVSFYTNFGVPDGDIQDTDVETLQSLFASNAKDINNRGILLIINSPGGNPLSAERFIKVCRQFSNDNYWTVVPDQAKSAATLIALGSEKILMTDTSELGPIDIQVPWKDHLIPAYSIIDAYEKLMNDGIKLREKQRIEPILQQLADFDASMIESLKNIRELSGEIAKKVMKRGMFRGLKEPTIKKLLKIFVDPSELKTHGRPIYYSDLKEIDKSNKYDLQLINKEDDVYSAIHEYHVRASVNMRNLNIAKMIESVNAAFTATSRGGHT